VNNLVLFTSLIEDIVVSLFEMTLNLFTAQAKKDYLSVMKI